MKPNEIEKIIAMIMNLDGDSDDEARLRRRLRKLAREAYLIGKHHGVMSCPKEDADHYFKFMFGVKP